MCASQQGRHYIQRSPALLRILPHRLIPSVPADFTGTINTHRRAAGNIRPALLRGATTVPKTSSTRARPHLGVRAGLDRIREHSHGVVHARHHRWPGEVLGYRVRVHDVDQVGRASLDEGNLRGRARARVSMIYI